MNKFFPCFLMFLCLAVTTKTSAQFRIVGYLNTWDNFPNNAANLDYTKTTHLNIAFANPDSTGKLTVFSGLSTVVNNAHAVNVKVLMSLGGAELDGTKKNWKNLTQPENVKSFCKKLIKYVQSNNLDGLDIDLEGNIIGENYGGFIQTLSSVMKPQGKLVTAAVATWFEKQIPSSSFAYFDFVVASQRLSCRAPLTDKWGIDPIVTGKLHFSHSKFKGAIDAAALMKQDEQILSLDAPSDEKDTVFKDWQAACFSKYPPGKIFAGELAGVVVGSLFKVLVFHR